MDVRIMKLHLVTPLVMVHFEKVLKALQQYGSKDSEKV